MLKKLCNALDFEFDVAVYVYRRPKRYGRKIQIPRWQTWARAARAKLETMMADAA